MTSSKRAFGLALFIMGLMWGMSCCAEAAEAEKPAEQTAPPPAIERVMPEDLSANLSTAFYSKYVWRGLELSKDSLVIFPSVTVGYKGFAVNVWMDLDTRYGNPPPGEDKEFNLQETDLTLSYANRVESLQLDYTVGWVYYDTDGFYGDTSTSNQELFAILALDVPLKPTLSVYNEIETGQAWYTSLSLSQDFDVYKDWSLEVGGWVSYYYNKSTEDFSALHDGNLWVGLTIPLDRYFSVRPMVHYSFPLSSDARDRIEANSFNGRDDQFFYGGITFELNF